MRAKDLHSVPLLSWLPSDLRARGWVFQKESPSRCRASGRSQETKAPVELNYTYTWEWARCSPSWECIFLQLKGTNESASSHPSGVDNALLSSPAPLLSPLTSFTQLLLPRVSAASWLSASCVLCVPLLPPSYVCVYACTYVCTYLSIHPPSKSTFLRQKIRLEGIRSGSLETGSPMELCLQEFRGQL